MTEAKSKLQQEKDKKKDQKDRGTQDDLEIMRLIICENKILFMKVMDKIRTFKKDGKDNLFQSAAKKGQAKSP